MWCVSHWLQDMIFLPKYLTHMVLSRWGVPRVCVHACAEAAKMKALMDQGSEMLPTFPIKGC